MCFNKMYQVKREVRKSSETVTSSDFKKILFQGQMFSTIFILLILYMWKWWRIFQVTYQEMWLLEFVFQFQKHFCLKDSFCCRKKKSWKKMSMLKKSEFSEGPLYVPLIISSLKTCCNQKLCQTNLKFGSIFLIK